MQRNIGQVQPDNKEGLIQNNAFLMGKKPIVSYRSGVNLTMSCKGRRNTCWVNTQPIKWATCSGFTLMEILIVVLIIGVLSAVAVPQYQQVVQKARFMQLVTASKTIVDAQNIYYLNHGVYASRADELDIALPISNDGRSFGRDGWTCTFSYANGVGGAPRTNCSLSHPDIALQWAHKTKRINCCTYPTDQFLGDTLCRSVTRASMPYNTDTNTMRCYTGIR